MDAAHPEHLAAAGELDAELPAARSCSTPTAGSCRSWPSWRRRATGGWAPIRTPTAGCCCATCACRTSAIHAVDVPAPGAVDAPGHGRAGPVPARRDRAQRRPAQLPHLRPRRDAVEPAGRRLRGRPTASGTRGPCRTTSSSRPSGRVLDSMLSEHQCQGWLEGYLLTGRHGLFNCYEAFIHIVDSMFNQHAKWLKVTAGAALAARHRLAELPARLARLAAGPQRLHPPGPGLPRPRRQQEGRHRPRLPAAGRQLPCCRSSDHCLRSRHYVNVVVAGKHAMPQWLTMEDAARALHRRASASGSGPATTRAPSRTS